MKALKMADTKKVKCLFCKEEVAEGTQCDTIEDIKTCLNDSGTDFSN